MNFFDKLLKCDIGLLPYSQFSTSNGLYNYVNWWGNKRAEDIWFTKFMEKNINCDKKFFFYSVFGSPGYIKRKCHNERDSINIFFTGENVSSSGISRRFRRYSKHMLDVVDLSMGFEYIDDEKYCRFPLWILYFFPPESTYEDIKGLVSKINSPRMDFVDRTIQCSNISRHDKNGMRAKICDSVSKIVSVRYEGAWRNNSFLLKEEYNDNKTDYLAHVKFNICPENSNEYGYVTEKIFQSIFSGAIPIYWGGMGHPEENLINKDAFLYWEDTPNFSNHLESLITNNKYYEEFASQPRLIDGAEDVIWGYFENLKSKIERLVC